MDAQPGAAVTVSTTADDDLNIPPVLGTIAKGAINVLSLPAIGWSALSIAGGLTLAAVTTGGAGLIALGLGAAAIGAQRTFTRVNSMRKVNKLIDAKLAGDDVKGPADSIFHKNPLLHLASGALLLGGGLALGAATGGIIPTVIAATMIFSGGISTLTGGLRTLDAGLTALIHTPKKIASLFHRKSTPTSAPPAPKAPAPAEPQSALGDLSVKADFDAAAPKAAPDAGPQTPATTPAAPKGPAAG